MVKALFLFAGLGGYAYPFYQSGEYDITFVEYLPDICELLKEKYPLAKVVRGDAINYMERNYKDFEFIFASPPCVANSKINCMRVPEKNNQYPRLPSLMPLEIKIFLDYYFEGDYIIENTIPYYKRLITWSYTVVGRHLILSNFLIPKNKDVGQNEKVLITMGSKKQAYVSKRYTTVAKWYLNELGAARPELQGYDFHNIICEKGNSQKARQMFNNTMSLEVSTYLFECCQRFRGAKVEVKQFEQVRMFG